MSDDAGLHDLADPCTLCAAMLGADAKRHTPAETVELNKAVLGVRARGPWHEELARPFPASEIAAKPRLWCDACRKAADKVCNRHKKVKCPECKQFITEAHVDLSYVGHADITRRLLSVDPLWSWRPAQHAVDKDVLLAAIATGNDTIVQRVIANSPPLTDQYGGMWMVLTVHDDTGQPVEMLGYGDHESKPPGNEATKVAIGDGIRNAAMRRGLALDLWSKSDRAETERDRLASEANDKKPASAPAKAATEGGDKPAATTTRTRGGRQAMPSNGEAVVAAQQVVNTAYDMAERYVSLRQAGKMTQPLAEVIGQLEADTLAVAKAKQLMRVKVYSRWTSNEMTVIDALRQAKQRIEDCDKTVAAQEAQKEQTGEQAGE